MSIPLHVTFHGIADSDDVLRCARFELDQLERLHPHIEACHVALTVLRNRHRGAAWGVQIALVTRGRKLTLDHDSGFFDGQEDQLVTLRGAFVGAGRLLLVEAKRLRAEAKAKTMSDQLVRPAA